MQLRLGTCRSQTRTRSQKKCSCQKLESTGGSPKRNEKRYEQLGPRSCLTAVLAKAAGRSVKTTRRTLRIQCLGIVYPQQLNLVEDTDSPIGIHDQCMVPSSPSTPSFGTR